MLALNCQVESEQDKEFWQLQQQKQDGSSPTSTTLTRWVPLNIKLSISHGNVLQVIDTDTESKQTKKITESRARGVPSAPSGDAGYQDDSGIEAELKEAEDRSTVSASSEEASGLYWKEENEDRGAGEMEGESGMVLVVGTGEETEGIDGDTMIEEKEERRANDAVLERREGRRLGEDGGAEISVENGRGQDCPVAGEGEESDAVLEGKEGRGLGEDAEVFEEKGGGWHSF